MSAELPGYDLTGYLADQIDAFAGMIEQRDLARSVAVGLEGELHAVTTERDALIAQLHRAETLIENALALCALDLEPTDGPIPDYEFGRRTTASSIRAALGSGPS